MWDAQMDKPCNQASHVYYISQPCLSKHVMPTSYPVSHIVHISQLEKYVMLDAHLISKHKK